MLRTTQCVVAPVDAEGAGNEPHRDTFASSAAGFVALLNMAQRPASPHSCPQALHHEATWDPRGPSIAQRGITWHRSRRISKPPIRSFWVFLTEGSTQTGICDDLRDQSYQGSLSRVRLNTNDVFARVSSETQFVKSKAV